MSELRHDWTREEVRAIHDLPLTQLLHRAQTVHREQHRPDAIQLCTLLSVKTGGCQENCGYCSQSSHHETAVEPERMLSVDEVMLAVREARASGATRFCMGAAWRDALHGPAFEKVLTMIRGIREEGLEACATLGMLDDEQAAQLADAGLTAYNHNLDTSENFYGEVVSTRSYAERLATLARVQDAGISLCCGGIIGLGEELDDRCDLLRDLANLDPHPGSVPINALVAMEGTPLEDQPPVDSIELVRMCATARIIMPLTLVRLSAGREAMSREAQLLCFQAGANSIFYGAKLLTAGNSAVDADRELLAAAGLTPLGPFETPDPTVQATKLRGPQHRSRLPMIADAE